MEIRPLAELPAAMEIPFDENAWRELAYRERLRDAGLSAISYN
jgi:hypothetical protein